MHAEYVHNWMLPTVRSRWSTACGITPDTTRWIFDRGVPRYAPDGTFEGYVGGCLDIHDRKEAAEETFASPTRPCA